jgi:hypothetical protein
LHHAAKGFEKALYMCLENAMRGSGDFGAMLGIAYGVKMLDKKTVTLLIENIKPRDFEPCEPFQIQGRPYIDNTGNFMMTQEPGQSPSLEDISIAKFNAKKMGKYAAAAALFAVDVSQNDVMKALKLGKLTVADMKLKFDNEHKNDKGGE